MDTVDHAKLRSSSTKVILQRDWKRNKTLYLLFLPVLLYYVIFQYGPMFGLLISFQNYKPATGILKSPWVGLKHFKDFFSDYYFRRASHRDIQHA